MLLLSALILAFLSIEIYGQNSYGPAPSAPPAYPNPQPTQPPYTPVINTQPQYTPVQSLYVTTPPAAPETGYGGEAEIGPAGYPLPTCYTNADGFMCCNKELENLMDNTYRNLSRSRDGKWKPCNFHQVAVATQRNAQKHFGINFEIVVGAGDYASKNYFIKDMICKIKRESSIILAFATPNFLIFNNYLFLS
uniref:Ground-like domain-containing protein n=1 Tax=Meloidogyne enterolobii TaxID=390850 RepID=A0A6V7TZ58_MELEN|nr:unnamed protein product [Meloidogyne enterolobii]